MTLEAMEKEKVTMLKKQLELLKEQNKLLKEQKRLLTALIAKQQEPHKEDDEDHDICYACGHRDATDHLKDQMNCVNYCMYCENGSRWIPKEEEENAGGE